MRRFTVGLLLLLGSSANAADTLGKTSVRTQTKTDVQAQVAGADGATVEQVSANNTAQSTGGLWALPAIVQSSLPTYSTNGNLVGLTVDASGRLYVVQDSTVTSSVNLKQVGGTAFALGNTTMSASLPVTIASNQTAWPAGLGSAVSASSFPVVIASDQASIATKPGAPTGATTNRGTATNIASSSTATVTCVGSLTASTPLKLYQVQMTGAALGRCTIRYNNNGATTSWFDLVVSPNSPTAISPCPAGFCSITSGASGTQAIEASCTNFDAAAQDFECSVQYCSAASGC